MQEELLGAGVEWGQRNLGGETLQGKEPSWQV